MLKKEFGINIIRIVLIGLLCFDFVVSIFISVVNPETYFFKLKVEGTKAICWLVVNGVVGVSIAHLLFKNWKFAPLASLLFFGYNFANVVFFSPLLGACPLFFTVGLILSILLVVLTIEGCEKNGKKDKEISNFCHSKWIVVTSLLTLLFAIASVLSSKLYAFQFVEQQNEDYLALNTSQLYSKLWNVTLENTKADNCVLNWLHIEIDKNGDFERIILEFYGIEDCKPKIYHVEVNRKGKMRWYSDDLKILPRGEHPLVLLKELEKFDFREIPSGDSGIVIDIGAISGSVEYKDNRCVDIYLLKNGSLIPLKRVVFESDRYWYPITICKRKIVNVGFKVDIEEQKIVAFVPQDLSKAKVVEFYDESTDESTVAKV